MVMVVPNALAKLVYILVSSSNSLHSHILTVDLSEHIAQACCTGWIVNEQSIVCC